MMSNPSERGRSLSTFITTRRTIGAGGVMVLLATGLVSDLRRLNSERKSSTQVFPQPASR